MRILRSVVVFCLALGPMLGRAQVPEWIWSSPTNQSSHKEVRYFRRTFTAKDGLIKSQLVASGDDSVEVFINGKKVASTRNWDKPAYADVTKHIIAGENVIAIQCQNETSYAGLIARLEMTMPTLGSSGQTYKPKPHAGLRWIDTLITDTNWVWSEHYSPNWTQVNFDDSGWKPAFSVGKLGVQPWGDIFVPPQATAAKSIHVEPGFKIELLHSADPTEGSWISMAIDPKGRFIISPQGDEGLLRISIAHGKMAKIDRIEQPVSSAMGLLCADNYLFVDGIGAKGLGIYRLRANGDSYEAPEFLRAFKTGGEHGPHTMVIGPDHKLYVVIGNFTGIPSDILPTSPHRNYADDQLLHRAEDGRGFGVGLKPPGGAVLSMDLNGKNCELFAAGTRNTYAVAFNPDGELIGFDSDMEWDWGTAWYRPTRVNHWVSGGDYGFREGTGKFPEYYEDTLPAVVNVGLGSPTGVMFGGPGKFPKWYRDACFMEDWAYGRLFAIHFTPKGASYDATVETVLRGVPLNLTGLEFGHDGALYLITGGRGTESGLYRLTYTGPDFHMPRETKAERAADAQAKEARRLRRDLEAFDGKSDPRIVDAVWASLSSPDRWIRYAARIALESQDVDWWKDRALSEPDTEGGLTALLALARLGSPDTQRSLLHALEKFPYANLDEQQELLKLRVLEVCFARQGAPDVDLAKQEIAEIDPLYPAADFPLNHELCNLELYLKALDAVGKTLALLDKAPTQEEQTYYVMRLRNIVDGWTLDERKDYLAWFKKDREHAKHPADILQYFKDVDRDYSDGASFPLFLENFRNEFVDTLTTNDRQALVEFLPKETNSESNVAATRKFVKDWTMQDLQPDLAKAKSGRSFDTGKAVFSQAQCILCHRMGSGGGSVGPELGAVASRLSSRDILESILEPSKVVSELYQNTIIETKDGDILVGRVVEENDQKLVLMTEPIQQTKVEVRKSDIAIRRASKVSPMPDGLVNSMKEGEIWDLIAYLEAGGKKNRQVFRK
ncbi:MAG TPA: heme-binding protein [Verrucomicrobiae bacterium]|nr:heme-binding protein [Verrucomicrobiae bacterium]